MYCLEYRKLGIKQQIGMSCKLLVAEIFFQNVSQIQQSNCYSLGLASSEASIVHDGWMGSRVQKPGDVSLKNNFISNCETSFKFNHAYASLELTRMQIAREKYTVTC